ncbi:DNA cytosine methyltransferase [Marinifilum fragile]|uniref:DNA cytosine methyltransferase n=1 Tax=Marinifilum fragile TaxID=570161 RepID=UPI002AAB4A71|nr:DNA cytosine methyltransferase [Marinifilum fragile]
MNRYLDLLNSQRIPKKGNGLNFISLFSGGGGLDLGFSLAGFKGLYSTDIIKHFCDTIRHNFPNHIVEEHDMYELSGNYVKDKIKVDVDMIIGGPPCQSFSILGNRKSTEDSRGRLVFEYARFIKEVSPKGFLFENVPGILTVNKGKDWEDLLKFFKKETGYHLEWKKLNAVNYGAPQFRERVILFGFKEKPFNNWPELMFGLNGEAPKRVFNSGLALENVENLPNHIKRIHSDRVSTRYSKIKQGERCRVDHTDRIDESKPSGTVLVGSSGGGGRPFIHPIEHRHLTVREVARLQSFPDWYEFEGTGTSQYRQVGNAVAPLFAKRLGIAVAEHLKGK